MKKCFVALIPLILIICSLNACGKNEELIFVLDPEKTLQENYDAAMTEYKKDPAKHRDLCDLQQETQEIIQMEDGKYYQSYVASNVDIRYIFIAREDNNDTGVSWLWNFVAVGTKEDYCFDNIGKIDNGLM